MSTEDRNAAQSSAWMNGNGSLLTSASSKRLFKEEQQQPAQTHSDSQPLIESVDPPRRSAGLLSCLSKKHDVVLDVPEILKGAASFSSSDSFGRNGMGIRSRRAFLPFLPADAKLDQGDAEQRQAQKCSGALNKPPLIHKLKSRLQDIPKPADQKKGNGETIKEKRSGYVSGAMRSAQASGALRSAQQRSGLVGKLKRADEEEEDPLKDFDLPAKYRKRECGFWIVVEWVSFFLILGGLATILAVEKLRKMERGGLILWKWPLLVMVLFCGRLVSGWIIWFFVIIIEKNFLLRKRVLYFVYALRRAAQHCLWLGFALLAWHLMVGPKADKGLAVIKYVTKVLYCFLIAAAIVLIKTLIVKVLASSFHVSNYFDRIQEALYNQYIMETLSGPPLVVIQKESEDQVKFDEEVAALKAAGVTIPSLPRVSELPPMPPKVSGAVEQASAVMPRTVGMTQVRSGLVRTGNLDKRSHKLEEETIRVEHLHQLDQKNVSAWNMKRLMNIIRFSSLTYMIDETVQEASLGMQTEIQSEWQAKVAAKQIFKNVARQGCKFITEEDLLRFIGEEDVNRVFGLFEGGTDTRKINKKALIAWVIGVYTERRALALSLNDTKTAVNKLHRIVDVIVSLIIIVVWLLVLNIASTQLLLFLSSQCLLVILVWGNTLKTILEAIVFLFVMHPFDVGDRCVVDGQQLVVEEMNILTTVFLGDFNAKVWYPNAVLATKPIQNFYRSPDMGDRVEFLVPNSTPLTKINDIKDCVKEYLQSKAQWWHEDFSLTVVEVSEDKSMKLALGLKHTMNHQDLGERFKRRGELVYELRSWCERLELEYKRPPTEMTVTMS